MSTRKQSQRPRRIATTHICELHSAFVPGVRRLHHHLLDDRVSSCMRTRDFVHLVRLPVLVYVATSVSVHVQAVEPTGRLEFAETNAACGPVLREADERIRCRLPHSLPLVSIAVGRAHRHLARVNITSLDIDVSLGARLERRAEEYEPALLFLRRRRQGGQRGLPGENRLGVCAGNGGDGTVWGGVWGVWGRWDVEHEGDPVDFCARELLDFRLAGAASPPQGAYHLPGSCQ